MTDSVELRTRLSDNNLTATLEMLVGGQLVGKLMLKPVDLDYLIRSLSNIRAGMKD
jgi:hypothetical protein